LEKLFAKQEVID